MLNYLQKRELVVMLYKMGEIGYPDIARILKVTKTTVYNIKDKSLEKIQNVIQKNKTIKARFKVAKIGKLYHITCAVDQVNNWAEILTISKRLPDIKVYLNNSQLEVIVTTHPVAFVSLARMFQKTELKKDEEEMLLKEQKALRKQKSKKNARDREKVKQYILKLEHFSVEQLFKKFEKVNQRSIHHLLEKLIAKGVIKRVRRGEYIVLKK